MKRLLCLALIFIMSLGIVPAGAISTAAAGGTPTLYVGGAVMRDGYYLANGADIATKVRPISGGYAYYKDGVLTLHDYEYCGDGYAIGTEYNLHTTYATVCCEGSLSIVLEGNNKLSRASDAQVSGIAVAGDLEIKESTGSLEIVGVHYGIGAGGGIVLNNSAVSLSAEAFCLYAWGDISLLGGSFDFDSESTGVYSWENITVSDAVLNITSAGTALNCEKTATVNGDLGVTAGVYGIAADEGVVLEGGTVDITAEYGLGSDAGSINVNGGTLTVDSKGSGMCTFGGGISITAGTVTVSTESWGLYSEADLCIGGGTVSVESKAHTLVSESGTVVISGGTISLKCHNQGEDDYYYAIKAPYAIVGSMHILASTEADGVLGEYVAAYYYTYDYCFIEAYTPSEDEPADTSSEDEPADIPSEDNSFDTSFEDESTDTSSEDDELAGAVYGDVNGDGVVNSLDAAYVLKYDAKLTALTEAALSLAEVNGDGTVNSLDAAQILKLDAKLIEKFPVE